MGGLELKPEEAFGQVLKRVRTDKQISQEKLALTGGLDRTFISLLERGLRQPSLTTILQIADSLGVPAESLIAMVKEELDESHSNTNINR